MNFIKFVFSLGILLTIISCETVTKQSCRETNWKSEGYQAASNGERADKNLIAECTQLSGKNVMDDYTNGYAEGIQKFCTKSFGLYWAREGNRYQNICPASLENDFLVGYSQGKMEKKQLDMQERYSESIVKKNSAFEKILTRDSCNFDSDCTKKASCDYVTASTDKKCSNSDKKCTFDSDCDQKFKCEQSLCRW